MIKNRTVHQAAMLFSSNMLVLLISIGISVLNTRLLSLTQYGSLKLIQSMFLFVFTIIHFGYFLSGGRLLAVSENEEKKEEIIGGMIAIAVFMSLGIIFIFNMMSFFVDSIFKCEIGKIIRVYTPLLFVFPLQACIENIMQGENRIYELSIFRLGPYLIYFIAVVLYNFYDPLTLAASLGMQLMGIAIFVIAMLIRIKPVSIFKKKYRYEIYQENKKYGFQVYLGMIANVATIHMSGLTIGYFVDSTSVGYFTLAVSVTTPLVMLSRSVGVTLYREFANIEKIPKKATKTTIYMSIFTLLAFLICIKSMILILYPKEYMPIIPLSYMLAIGSVARGGGDFINRFLGAKGKGKEIRNSALANGIINLVGYTVLVFMFGVMGAVITKIFSDLIYFYMMIYYYKK